MTHEITTNQAGKRPDVTREMVLERFDYDPLTGLFTWKRSIAKGSVGRVAGSVCKIHGHRHLSFHGCKFKAHRVAWLVMHGCWPDHEIDHINGNPDDNRIANLRDVTQRTNTENIQRAKKSNKSTRLLGAYPHASGRFTAKIMVNRKGIHLGQFDTAQEAHQAYLNAKRELHSGSTL